MLLVFGAITIDFIFPVPALPRPGDNAWSEGGWFETGGKGAVEAIAAARDGTRVTLVGAVGNDLLGDTAVSDLSRNGLNCTERCAAHREYGAGRNLRATRWQNYRYHDAWR